MKSFRNYISEEVLPSVQVADGGLDIEKPAVRAAINAAIAGVVSQPAVTPYVVFNRLSKLLAQYHIVLPKRFLEGDKGVEVFEIKQFGHRMGMTDSGEFVNHVPSTHYLFLQYGIITPMGVTYAKPLVGGMFRVTARLVDKEELDRLLDMAEISLREDAECRQMSAKAMAPKEEMHDITSDEKKKGNKSAVADSEKGLKEELSHGARELTLHADNDAQLHRSSHQPIIKNLQRKHAKGTYDHEKATKLWKYHADRAAKSYEKQHGGKFSVADRKQAASHFADSARDEHGFGTTKEETQLDEISKKLAVKTYLKRSKKNEDEWSERGLDAPEGKNERKVRTSEKRIAKKFGQKTANKAFNAGFKAMKEEKGDRLTPQTMNNPTGRDKTGASERDRGITFVPKNTKGNDSDMPQNTLKPEGKFTNRVDPEGRKNEYAPGGTMYEAAPPGREDQVKALKKKFPKGSGSPFAIAWSSYNKSKK